MTEREFEQRLRGYYRAEVEAAGPLPIQLRESVVGIPERMPTPIGFFQTRRGFVLLTATAMLTALLVGGAIAIGAGILRLPWERDRTPSITSLSSEAIAPIACDQTLPDGLALTITRQDDNLVDDVFVYDDGLLVRLQEDLDTSTATWSQRRLSTDGVDRLLAAVEASGLRDCIGVPASETGPGVKARTDGGVVAMSLGGRGWLRTVTAAELEAGAELAGRLSEPDLGIPASEWTAGEWEAYGPERWEVRVSRWEGLGGSYETVHHVQWQDLVLPDGSGFLTFGTSVRVEPGSDFVEHRCRVISPGAANEMEQFLGDPVDAGTPDQWGFADRSGGVLVRVTALLPHEPGCAYSGPVPSPDVPRENLIGDVHACDYVPESVLAMTNSQEYEEHGSGGWAACESWTGGGGWVFASRHRVSRQDAVQVVRAQFGIDGFTEEEIGGNPVYFNVCTESDSNCSPAVAISVEPHFIIAVPDFGQGASLREIARAVIERLEG